MLCTYKWATGKGFCGGETSVKYNPRAAICLMDGWVLAGVMNFFSTWGDSVCHSFFFLLRSTSRLKEKKVFGCFCSIKGWSWVAQLVRDTGKVSFAPSNDAVIHASSRSNFMSWPEEPQLFREKISHGCYIASSVPNSKQTCPTSTPLWHIVFLLCWLEPDAYYMLQYSKIQHLSKDNLLIKMLFSTQITFLTLWITGMFFFGFF